MNLKDPSRKSLSFAGHLFRNERHILSSISMFLNNTIPRWVPLSVPLFPEKLGFLEGKYGKLRNYLSYWEKITLLSVQQLMTPLSNIGGYGFTHLKLILSGAFFKFYLRYFLTDCIISYINLRNSLMNYSAKMRLVFM